MLCLESNSNSIDELFENYPSLYKCTEIIWMPDTFQIESSDFIAREWIGKLSLEPIPLPKHLHLLESNSNVWNHSPLRFKNLIFTYCSLYKEMMSSIRKQQNILQVSKSIEIFLCPIDRLMEFIDLHRQVLINYQRHTKLSIILSKRPKYKK